MKNRNIKGQFIKGERSKRIENKESILCACGCGYSRPRYDNQGRECKYIQGHIKLKIKRTEIINCACDCGKTLYSYDNHGRQHKYIRGHNRPMKDKHHTLEAKIKDREHNLGKHIGTNIGEKNGMYGKKGILHPNWIDGRSFGEYGPEFNKEKKDWIRKRDNYQCQLCFKHQDELRDKHNKKYKLHIHHIDYHKNNSDPKNQISLCRPCHGLTTMPLKNRENWKQYFQARMDLISMDIFVLQEPENMILEVV